jgi:hypothetical protein
MKKAGIFLLISVLCLLAFSAWAKHSDSYPMGSYSYLQHTSTFFKNNSAALAAKLKELGFNLTVIETDNSDKTLSELLRALDENGIDAILNDKSWSNDPKDSRSNALVGLSTSNYHRFEAEFIDGTPVKPEDINSSVYWYGTVIGENNKNLPVRVGKAASDKNASYDYIWKCLPTRDKEGYAYTDITYRWKNNQGNAIKYGNEFRIHNTHKDADKDTDSLYIRFRLKIANISPQLRTGTALLNFSPTGYLGKIVKHDGASLCGEGILTTNN